MCRSLEEFRENYLRIKDSTPPPDAGDPGPSTRPTVTGPQTGDEEEGSETSYESDPDHKPQRFRLGVKREEY